jgi:hypothetical protein
MNRLECGSFCSSEDDFKEEGVELSVLFRDYPVISLHAEYLGLAVLLNSLHDHADPADLALAGD